VELLECGRNASRKAARTTIATAMIAAITTTLLDLDRGAGGGVCWGHGPGGRGAAGGPTWVCDTYTVFGNEVGVGGGGAHPVGAVAGVGVEGGDPATIAYRR
jgi:hypothetical protein